MAGLSTGNGLPNAVVTGVAMSTALATDAESTWKKLLDGQTGIRTTSRSPSGSTEPQHFPQGANRHPTATARLHDNHRPGMNDSLSMQPPQPENGVVSFRFDARVRQCRSPRPDGAGGRTHR
jgi:hypothetical protein